MLEAMTARDSVAMREVLVQHLNNKRDSVLALMRSSDIHPLASLAT